MAGTDCGIDSAGRSSIWQGHSLIEGQAAGKVLFSDVGLSFWGGVDPLTGMVMSHPIPTMTPGGLADSQYCCPQR
jgi:hypothetical protein